ncbi:MAG: hypothetical protein ISQ75_07860 [Puniceicoccaceae bacterium]|nr:hypothetical protein [Puniceicoccaceae bacterium]MBL6920220.1 hypothetical protein [Puniceicoccaceae bacterium]
MKLPLSCLVLLVSSVFAESTKMLEQWTFSETDGTSLSLMLSDKGTPLASVDRPSARVKDGKLWVDAEGEYDSIYLINEFAGKPFSSGVYQVNWTFTNAAFAGTHGVKGKANAGFDIRDTGDTRYKGNDDVVLGGVRLSYEKKAIEIQYQDSLQERYTEIALVDRVVLPEPLHVRILFDLDRSGEPGSMQVFLRLGEEEEINPLADGIIPKGVQLKGFRLTQQITNGGSNWQQGDSVGMDNFTLSRVAP